MDSIKLCEVCGAKIRFAHNRTTCDTLCTRAKRNGIDRGLQTELEAKRDARRPYPTVPEYLPPEAWPEVMLYREFANMLGYAH